MKHTILTLLLILGFFSLTAQDVEIAECFKSNGINYFIKSEPTAEYEIIGEQKVTGVGKTTEYTSGIIGAAGFNQIQKGIEEMNNRLKKKAKKGEEISYDGILVDKPKLVTFIRLKPGTPGAGSLGQGAMAKANLESKSGKLIFYMSRPIESYEVISEITYNEGGLGETMRGGNQLDVAINGMLDKGQRWVKKGKISKDFDALLIDYSSIVRGKIKGELIKFN